MSVAVANCSLDEVSVKIDKGTVKPGFVKGQYAFFVKEKGDRKVSIFYKNERMSSFSVRGKYASAPVAQLNNGSNAGNISISELKKIDKLKKVLPDFDFNVVYSITSFELTKISANGKKTNNSK
jgi:hypothetical protein